MVERQSVKPRGYTETGVDAGQTDMFAVEIPLTHTRWNANTKLQLFFTHVRRQMLAETCLWFALPLPPLTTLCPSFGEIRQELWAEDPLSVSDC